MRCTRLVTDSFIKVKGIKLFYSTGWRNKNAEFRNSLYQFWECPSPTTANEALLMDVTCNTYNQFVAIIKIFVPNKKSHNVFSTKILFILRQTMFSFAQISDISQLSTNKMSCYDLKRFWIEVIPYFVTTIWPLFYFLFTHVAYLDLAAYILK